MHICIVAGNSKYPPIWRRLATICINEIWETVSWDELNKKFVPDRNGQLRKIGIEDIFDVYPIFNARPDEPPKYTGPLPSEHCLEFIARLEADHREWVERRAAIEALNAGE